MAVPIMDVEQKMYQNNSNRTEDKMKVEVLYGMSPGFYPRCLCI